MYITKTLVRHSVVLGVLACSSVASAEWSAPEDLATQSSSSDAETTADSTAADSDIPDVMDEPSTSRFRWGVAANGGPMMGAYSGGAGGVDARLGMQMSSMLGLYAQPLVLVGAGASADANGASATGLALYGVGAIVDATLADMFYVAGGPELLMGGVGTASGSSGGNASASSTTGAFFSVAGRAGVAFGSKRPERRKAFTLGVDMHMVFAGGATFMPMVALGYEAF